MNLKENNSDILFRIGYSIITIALAIPITIFLQDIPNTSRNRGLIQFTIFTIYVVGVSVLSYVISRNKLKKEEKQLQEKIIDAVAQERKLKEQEILNIRREYETNLEKKLEEIHESKIKEIIQNYSLILRCLDGFTDAIRERLYFTSDLNDHIMQIISSGNGNLEKIKKEVIELLKSEAFDETRRKRIQVNQLLAYLCDDLRADAYHRMQIENALDVHLYFKATIFEPSVCTVGEGILTRHDELYKYPPGLDPKTIKIEEKLTPKATAIQSWRNQQIYCVEDIPSEAIKHGECIKKGHLRPIDCECLWENLWEDQHKSYGSMLCAYIARGRPKSKTRKVRGILSIDTPQRLYFKSDRLSKTFWADYIAPIRTYIALLYELEDFQKQLITLLS